MSYDIILSPDAEQAFLGFPLPIQNLVEERLRYLAENPARAMRESRFPHLRKSQVYNIDEDFYDGRDRIIFVVWRISQDETALHILVMTASPPYKA